MRPIILFLPEVCEIVLFSEPLNENAWKNIVHGVKIFRYKKKNSPNPHLSAHYSQSATIWLWYRENASHVTHGSNNEVPSSWVTSLDSFEDLGLNPWRDSYLKLFYKHSLCFDIFYIFQHLYLSNPTTRPVLRPQNTQLLNYTQTIPTLGNPL